MTEPAALRFCLNNVIVSIQELSSNEGNIGFYNLLVREITNGFPRLFWSKTSGDFDFLIE